MLLLSFFFCVWVSECVHALKHWICTNIFKGNASNNYNLEQFFFNILFVIPCIATLSQLGLWRIEVREWLFKAEIHHLWLSCRQPVNTELLSVQKPTLRRAAISGMSNEPCFFFFLAARPFNSFNTEENKAPLASGAIENRAVNLDCGVKWTDRSGGVSSVCEQRCISLDTPRHFSLSSVTSQTKRHQLQKAALFLFFGVFF